jgi:hypothetical protein
MVESRSEWLPENYLVSCSAPTRRGAEQRGHDPEGSRYKAGDAGFAEGKRTVPGPGRN